MSVDFGSDVSTHPDLDELLAPYTGRLVLLESIARRMETPRGALWWAPEYGSDLGALLDGDVDAARLRAAATALQSQLLQDERVQRATVEASYDGATRALRVTVSATDALGPFTRVFVLDANGVARLLEAR